MQADDILFGFRTMDFDVRHFAYSLKGTQTEGASWPEKTENVRRFPPAGFTRFFFLSIFSQGWNFSGHSRFSGFRYLSESNENGTEMQFECESSPLKIQTLTISHPCLGNMSTFCLNF